MDNEEARAILERHLASWCDRSWSDLRALIGDPDVREETGPSGVRYQIQIRPVWDDAVDGDIRVLGAIDDGWWRAFVPLCADLIKRPDGTFVDE